MLTVNEMIKGVEAEAKISSSWTGRGKISAQVLAAMVSVPRHVFVPEALFHSAYENTPLPIGYGQTISQPFIVALMTDLLGLQGDEVVLEVGTGSGYQAAILSRLAKKVYSIDNMAQLIVAARQRLQRLGYENVEVIWGNGYEGLPAEAPFDAILVAAAAPYVPKPLLDQLRPGGKMLIPVGRQGFAQELKLLQKSPLGEIESSVVLPVAFVPLTDKLFSDASLQV
ncbi:MAG TPA: protein-L-isoaspartate(D-aspartate) O-methyltransferase [Candidatus Tenderia electrophaga]|uniref:Protein-L-isoaspartate O-methyltransferase n=1 Tax=Candidatus Tenderia electrophaga TaxID=1748243 RepID=A0A832J3K7_9GAMM|nr:protein-L-isoaspartate(D-aspartate) O-methyltransferase [Candidatus Tenderia electrophaga]